MVGSGHSVETPSERDVTEAPGARGRFLPRIELMTGMTTQVQSQVQEMIRRENLLDLVTHCWQGAKHTSAVPR